MDWLHSFHDYLLNTSRFWVEDDGERSAFLAEKENRALERKKQQLKDREATIVKTMIDGQILTHHQFAMEHTVDYWFYVRHLIKQKNEFYIEEEAGTRRARFRQAQLTSDEPLTLEGTRREEPALERDHQNLHRFKFQYRRLEAVRYADRWWNAHNPKYRAFDVDCTNYVSQCLHAGGAPMRGAPNRAKGWWYAGNNWSYSWSVAHALRWYLPGSPSGLRAKEVSSASQLVPGDVICYDFEGDGHWDHNTIVTAKDAKGMPLVNAHTSNTRRHYWAYEDSVAWTPNIKYKFFHIIDDE